MEQIVKDKAEHLSSEIIRTFISDDNVENIEHKTTAAHCDGETTTQFMVVKTTYKDGREHFSEITIKY